MNDFLEKLLDGTEVEWLPLGEVLVRTKGTKITAEQMKKFHKDNAPVKIFAGGKTFALVEFEDIPKKNINKEPSIIVKSRGIIEFEYYDKPFSHKNEMWSYNTKNEKINLKYIYHYLKQNEFYFQRIASRMQMPQIATPDTNKFKIPIPCPNEPEKSLAIQNEVVRILDAFTALTAELTTRKQQYQYYRDNLLTFAEDEVEWKTLGDVVLKTQNINWKNQTHSFRYIDLSSVCRDKNTILKTTDITADNAPSRAKKIVIENDVIFATTRPTQMRFCVIDKEYSQSIASTGYCVLRAKTEEVLPKWIFFYLSTENFKIYLEENQSGSAYPAISDTKVKEFKIPIPPLKKQAEIVAILDKFDTLTNSISEGLPKEIELRQKQYEYYREMLLNFPKPKENTQEMSHA